MDAVFFSYKFINESFISSKWISEHRVIEIYLVSSFIRTSFAYRRRCSLSTLPSMTWFLLFTLIDIPSFKIIFSSKISLDVKPYFIKLFRKLSFMASKEPRIRLRCISFDRLMTKVPFPFIFTCFGYLNFWMRPGVHLFGNNWELINPTGII